MGTIVNYRCVECEHPNIRFTGTGMMGSHSRETENFNCPSCSALLRVDCISSMWQWTPTWCGSCRHAFIPCFADYYPGMTFEEAAQAHANRIPVKFTTSVAPPGFSLLDFKIYPDETDRAMSDDEYVPEIVHGQTEGIRPCSECGGDTFEKFRSWGFWD